MEKDNIVEEKISPDKEVSVLTDIAAAVGRTIDLEEVLETALRRIMELTETDSSGIYLYDPQLDQLVLRKYHKFTDAFVKEKGKISWGEGCAGTAAESGEIFASYNQPEASFVCEDAERLMGIDCLAAVPIYARGRVLGVFELFAPVSRRLTPREGELLIAIGHQIGIAIENAQLYEDARENVDNLTRLQRQLREANTKLREHLEQERYIASTLQEAMVSRTPPNVANHEIASRYLSATEMAEIGGDFFDFVSLPDNRLAIMIGDVSGRGVASASLATQVRDTVRAFALEDPNPGEVLCRTNRAIALQRINNRFVTLFYMVLDPQNGQKCYASAGHPPPLVMRTNGRIEELALGSAPIGVQMETTYKEHYLKLGIGDVLAFYTDGLIEARNGDDFFGEEGVRKALSVSKFSTAEEIASALISAAENFTGGRMVDDVALVVLKRTPAP